MIKLSDSITKINGQINIIDNMDTIGTIRVFEGDTGWFDDYIRERNKKAEFTILGDSKNKTFKPELDNTGTFMRDDSIEIIVIARKIKKQMLKYYLSPLDYMIGFVYIKLLGYDVKIAL